MIAVRLTPDLRSSVLGAPACFAARGRPRTPEELTRYECIRYRILTAGSIIAVTAASKHRSESAAGNGEVGASCDHSRRSVGLPPDCVVSRPIDGATTRQ